ncbi:MAG: thioredoxin domain-containing protein, partial [Pseudomonadota bacterium]
MSPQLGALLAAQRVRPDERLAGFLRLTLDQMSTRAMRDHLGGGFFRYTVDPGWTTPHFEKMLYSQAELVRLYLAAARGLGVPAYRAVARDTLDFVLRDMAGPQGGYIASLSAVDARGNEGGAYLWTPEELATLLSEEDLALATAYWSLEPALSPDLGLLPQRLTAASEVASALAVPEPVLAMRVADLRGRLLSARAARPAPRDTKELAGWNGLMLSALVAGAREFGDSRYADAAAGLAAYLRTLWDGKQLYRAREGVRFLGQSGLSDYAYVAAGLADWAEFRGSSEDLQLARELFGLAWKNYFSDDGWILASNALVPGMRREAAFQDGPLASPAAVLVSLAQRQQLHQQQVAGLGRARAMAAPMVLEMPFWHATHARNLIDSKKPAGDLKKPVAGRPAAAHRQGTKS